MAASFEAISKLVAAKCNAGHEMGDSGEFAYIALPFPVCLTEGNAYGSLRWYYLDAMIGMIFDVAAFPALDLLKMNNKRDNMFAIRQTGRGPILVARDRIAVPEDLDETTLVDVLCARIVSDLQTREWNFPGVENWPSR